MLKIILYYIFIYFSAVGIEEKNIVCEPCVSGLYGAFDTDKKEVITY